MAIINDWKIKARGAHCSHSERPFEDEEDFYTSIFDDPETDGFIRKDFSVSAWDELRASFDPAPFSFWKTTYKAPEVVEKEDPNKEVNSIEGLLSRLIEEDEANTENARYILAIMLERKKKLVQQEVNESETRKLLVYEHRDTGAIYIVADPRLRLDEIESVQMEVAELLAKEDEKNQAPPEAETDSSATEEQAPDTGQEQSEEQCGEEPSSENAGTSEEQGDETSQTEDEAISASGEEAADA
ncbi:MAG: hypothetical protein AAF226_12945 [Verrucomicrobiota bacterium]